MLGRDSRSSSREDVVEAIRIRAVKANSSDNHRKSKVEDSNREQLVKEEAGHQSAIAAVLGATLPRTAPLWSKMLVEEAFRPQGVEDAVSLATAARRLHTVSPLVYTRW